MAKITRTFLGPGTIKLPTPDDRRSLPRTRGDLVVVDSEDRVLQRFPERFGEPGCLDRPKPVDTAQAEKLVQRASALETSNAALTDEVQRLRAENEALRAELDTERARTGSESTGGNAPSVSSASLIEPLAYGDQRKVAAALGMNMHNPSGEALRKALEAVDPDLLAEAVQSIAEEPPAAA